MQRQWIEEGGLWRLVAVYGPEDVCRIPQETEEDIRRGEVEAKQYLQGLYAAGEYQRLCHDPIAKARGL